MTKMPNPWVLWVNSAMYASIAAADVANSTVGVTTCFFGLFGILLIVLAVKGFNAERRKQNAPPN